MSHRVRVIAAALAVLALAMVLPAGAGAHAVLLKGRPAANGVLTRTPAAVTLSFSEAIESRFAIISVTDKNGNRVTAGPPSRCLARAANSRFR